MYSKSFLDDLFSIQYLRCLLAFVAALILAIASPILGWAILVFVALVPLFLLIKSSVSYRKACLEAFVFFFSYNILTLHFLATIHPLNWLGLDTASSLLVAALAVLVPAFVQSLAMLPVVLVIRALYLKNFFDKSSCLSFIELCIIAIVWTALSHKFSLFLAHYAAAPINQISYSLVNLPWIANVASWIGASGLEIIIVLVNATFANIIMINANYVRKGLAAKFFIRKRARGDDTKKYQPLLLIPTLLLLCIAVSFNQLSSEQQLSYAIVQKELSTSYTRYAASADDLEKFTQDQLALTNTVNADFVLWAEASLPTTNQGFLHRAINNGDLSAQVLALGTYHKSKAGTHNSLLVVDQNAKKLSFYDKQNLVPFGEYTPGIDLMPDVLKQLARNTVGLGFTAGASEQETIQTSLGKLGSSICFELIFPELVRQQVESGAEFLVNINDLSWFKSPALSKMFTAVAKMRAIESQRDILLASNVGELQYISASGKISRAKEVLAGKLDLYQNKSLFTQYGW